MNTEFVHSALAADPNLGELVGSFVDGLPNRICALKTQVESGDWEQLRRTVHQLKGAAGSYGFHAITHSAVRLEDAARDGCQEEEVLLALDELLGLCRRVRAGVPARPD